MVDNSSSSISNSDAGASDLDKLVNGARLLELLWDSESRPSLQWLRKQTKCRMIPFVRRGRLIFYRPRSVMSWFAQKECFPSSMAAEARTRF